jgi:hypothetical protein
VPLLFSYGTLQQADVQISTFGRRLDGRPDSLVGFLLTLFEISDPEVVRISGKTHHPMATFTGNPEQQIPGVVFEVTDCELAQADSYETSPAYRRCKTLLLSGREAWVYADARAVPARNS